jgi:hypothetical protein
LSVSTPVRSAAPVTIRHDPTKTLPTTIALMLCAIALAPTLTYRMGTDQGVFAYMGAAILDGRWPYLHTWESDFPGLMWLQALEILVLGKSIVMFRLFDFMFQLGNAYLIFRITTRIAGGAIAGSIAAVLFCLVYQGYGPWNTAQREGFGLVFVLTGFWLYFTAERRPAWLTAAGIGLGLGAAVMIKPTLGALAAFYVPLAVRLTNARAWRVVAAAALAAAAPIGCVMIAYSLRGGLMQLYEACIAYQSIYTARLRGVDPLPVYWMNKISRLGRNAIVLSLVYPPFLLWGSRRVERGMVYFAYLGSVYAVFVQGTFAGYHYIPGLALGSVLIGSGFVQMTSLVSDRATAMLGGRRVSIEPVAAALVLLLAFPAYIRWPTVEALATLRFLNPPVPGEFRRDTVFDFTEDFELAAYLRSHTRPDDAVQVWGYESLVYYLADRHAASRFQMTHPLVMRAPGTSLTPMQLRWRSEFLRDVAQRPPSYIAVVRQDNWWWAPEQRTSEELLDDFPEWKRVIERNYRLEGTIGRFLIYRRTAPNTPVTLVVESPEMGHA